MLAVPRRARVVAIAVLAADKTIGALHDNLATLVDSDVASIVAGNFLGVKRFCVSGVSFSVDTLTSVSRRDPLIFFMHKTSFLFMGKRFISI